MRLLDAVNFFVNIINFCLLAVKFNLPLKHQSTDEYF
jgi:hypothetical protein